MLTRRTFLQRASGLLVPAAGLIIPRGLAQVGLRDPAFVALTKSQAAAAYSANASTFDGTNDYMTRGANLTGNADGKKGLVSFWFKANSDGSVKSFYSRAGYLIEINKTAANKVQILGYDSGVVKRLDLITTSAYTAASGWHHVLASWDMATAGARHLYVDGVDQLNVTTFTDATLAYSGSDHGIGANPDASQMLNACLSEVYLNFAEYMDITVASNRLKFSTTSGTLGAPISLGATGSTPTGTAPIMYFPDVYTSFQTNRGTGGNFTVTGALSTCTAP